MDASPKLTDTQEVVKHMSQNKAQALDYPMRNNLPPTWVEGASKSRPLALIPLVMIEYTNIIPRPSAEEGNTHW